MTQTSERYAKLANQMAARIAAVPADGWDAATPCEGWTACDLLDHLCDGPAASWGWWAPIRSRPAPPADADEQTAFLCFVGRQV